VAVDEPLLLPCLGVLLDCDGVLVDSDASVHSAWGRWATEHGLDPATVVAMVYGRRSTDTVAALVDPSAHAAALARVVQLEVEQAHTVPPVPGAVELVTTMGTGTWAVVTSAVRVLAVARLRAAGFPDPGVLVTGDDVHAGKPHPQGYLAGAAGLGLAPADTVVVEDAVAGVRAARAAGVGAVVGVGERALQSDADLVVADLRALRWTLRGLTAAGPGVLRAPVR
jgi:sugar-phosphatase